MYAYFFTQVLLTIKDDCAHIHLVFLNLINSLLKRLTNEATTEILFYAKQLLASESYGIPLFSTEFMQIMKNIRDVHSLKIILLPFMSWLDYSILEDIVKISGSEEAILELLKYGISIDYQKPIISYPIPEVSQLMIPFDDSDYTVICTKCNFNINEAPLQEIVDMKCTLTRAWKITDHALQLIAKNAKRNLLYWMIPKCVLKIVEDEKGSLDLRITTETFPRNLIEFLSRDDIDMESHYFFYLKVTIYDYLIDMQT